MERNTIQKAAIEDSFCVLRHPTADEVWLHVAERIPTISRATIYRNLNQMVRQGKLHKLCFADGAERYDNILTPHYHLRCHCCGLLHDISLPYQHGLEKQIHNAEDFDINGHEILLLGLCPGCKNKLKDMKEVKEHKHGKH